MSSFSLTELCDLPDFVSTFERDHFRDYVFPHSTNEEAAAAHIPEVRKLRRFGKRKNDATFPEKFHFVTNELFAPGKSSSSPDPSQAKLIIKTAWEVCREFARAAAFESNPEKAKNHRSLMCATATAMLVLAIPFVTPKEALTHAGRVVQKAVRLTHAKEDKQLRLFHFTGPLFSKAEKAEDTLLRRYLSKTGPFLNGGRIRRDEPLSATTKLDDRHSSMLERYIALKIDEEALTVTQATFVRRVVAFLWEAQRGDDIPLVNVAGIDDDDALSAILSYGRIDPLSLFEDAYDKSTLEHSPPLDVEEIGSALTSFRKTMEPQFHLPPCIAFAKANKPGILKKLGFAKTHGLVGAMIARVRNPEHSSGWHEDVNLYKETNISYHSRGKPIQHIKGARFFAPNQEFSSEKAKKVGSCLYMKKCGACPYNVQGTEEKEKAKATLKIYYDEIGTVQPPRGNGTAKDAATKCAALAEAIQDTFYVSALNDHAQLERLEKKDGPDSFPKLAYSPYEFTRISLSNRK